MVTLVTVNQDIQAKIVHEVSYILFIGLSCIERPILGDHPKAHA